MKYVLDTNIFNRVLDGRFKLFTLPDVCSFVATKIQVRELEAAPEPRRTELLTTFTKIAPDLAPAAFSLDISGAGFDEGEWSCDDRVTRMREALEAIKSKPNNWQDALIASVALKNGYSLVTADKDLANVAISFGINVHHVQA
jgi:rRNA-processing protein FCF1